MSFKFILVFARKFYSHEILSKCQPWPMPLLNISLYYTPNKQLSIVYPAIGTIDKFTKFDHIGLYYLIFSNYIHHLWSSIPAPRFHPSNCHHCTSNCVRLLAFLLCMYCNLRGVQFPLQLITDQIQSI